MLNNKKCTNWILICTVLFFQVKTNAQYKYNNVFNPMRGLVDQSEKPNRDELLLNGKWLFMPVFNDDLKQFNKPDNFNWDAVPLKVPSPWNVNSFAKGNGSGGDFLTFPSYPKNWEKAKIGWMKKDFLLPDNWKGKQVKLHFGAIAGFAKVFVNDHLVGENLDIFFPTDFDITPYLKQGSNEILVGVAKASLTDDQGKYGRRNYVAGSFWGQHIAGIWQDVSLIALPQVSISDVFINPDVENNSLNFSVTITNHTKNKQTVYLNTAIKQWFKPQTSDVNLAPIDDGYLKDEVLKIADNKKYHVKPGESITISFSEKVDNRLKYWTPESPTLYGSVVELKGGNNKISDTKYTRFGWRQFSVSGTQLLLNGNPIVLKGDSWHFMGVPQMTRRYAWGWFKMLKEANANAVRLHAQPYPSFYLDMADEMGICVLDETAIWSSDGGPKMDSDAYWEYCKNHVKSLVMRDRNHPSIFGWSVCNETIPVVVNVMHAPESIVERQVNEINNWITIVKELDPSRDWISGDGEDMRPTNLPTVIGHYGDENSMKKWSSEAKPWGIGETGMAYYGTPKQVSVINGNRAYESQLGRMEGLATEAYDLIHKQLSYGASYASVFNIVWYGLKPLHFGLDDISRSPKPEDGIFFLDYIEAIPGMQPERLGPYTSTINPGYDPGLPLYDPWPMFKAIQAVNATPEKPYLIQQDNNDKFKSVPALAKTDQVAIICGNNSELKKYLGNLGVPFVEPAKGNKPKVLIVDGKTATLNTNEEIQIKDFVNSGGKVWIWGVSTEKLEKINRILPYELNLSERTANSFLIKGADELVANLEHKDFYFTEMITEPVMHFGLSGVLLQHATVLLEACDTDWSRWNGKAEYLKTAAVYRSEQEAKSDGAAIVKIRFGKADVYLSSIDLVDMKYIGEKLTKTLLSNLGIVLKEVAVSNLAAFSENGTLQKALVISNDKAANLVRLNNQQFKETFKAVEHPEVIQVNDEGFFDFGDQQQATISLWVYSPRSLLDLLVEPDMPKVDMLIDKVKNTLVYINGNLVVEKLTSNQNKKLENLPLEQGWNHVVLQLNNMEGNGGMKTKIRLESNNKVFLKQLKSSVGL
jgi:Glycosyl hydrolases family 2, sugar binding domain/Glycosyl hydrolases family 2, TIM barrel domain/Glycosyl hydrolases family 2